VIINVISSTNDIKRHHIWVGTVPRQRTRGSRNRGPISSKGSRTFASSKRLSRRWGLPSIVFNMYIYVPYALWQEVKRPGYEANRSRPSSAKMKNVWKNTYIRRPKCLQDVVLNSSKTLPFWLLQCYISLSSVVLDGTRTFYPGDPSFKSRLVDRVQWLCCFLFSATSRTECQHHKKSRLLGILALFTLKALCKLCGQEESLPKGN